MKKAFTILEVSILFVIFLIVALLVVPLSLDDTLQAKNASRWRKVQGDFENIFYSISTLQNSEGSNFYEVFNSVMEQEIKNDIQPYKITYLNNTFPGSAYRFSQFKQTYSNSIVAYNLYTEPKDGVYGILMYDVNGTVAPNKWGKDIFGYQIFQNKFEPFCRNDSIAIQKQDCSTSGTGLCCSNFYLIGGKLN